MRDARHSMFVLCKRNMTNMDTRKKKVLCVDDSPGILSLCKELLEDNGFEVFIAADGKAALELLAQHLHDIGVAVIDNELPGITGLLLAETIKKSAPTVAVLMFSGLPPDEGASSPWIDSVLNKEAGITALIGAVRYLAGMDEK
jgi:CheY-like chemotaxis protein